MKSRLAEIGGRLVVETSPGNGSKVIAQIKLRPEATPG
jgi:signal transduction histidine kinase